MANNYCHLEKSVFDKAAIMRDAWKRIRGLRFSRYRFALSLSVVWAQAKAEKANTNKTPAQLRMDKIQAEHERRDRSDRIYCGSRVFKRTVKQIEKLKQAA